MAVKDLKAAAKKIGNRYGYTGMAGGWIFRQQNPGRYTKGDERAVCQGWWSLGRQWQEAGLITGDYRQGFEVDWEAARRYFEGLNPDELTVKYTAFESFDALVNAQGGYRPTIYPRCKDEEKLAQAYNDFQAERGDPRRVHGYQGA